MANVVFHIALEYLENSYVQPSWWQGRTKPEAEYVIQRVRTGTGFGPDRKPDSLATFGYQFSSSAVEQIVQA